MTKEERLHLVELTAHIMGAYVEKNPLPATNIPDVIEIISNSLWRLISSESLDEKNPASKEPAVNPKRSVHRDYIVCLEEGKKYKSLKRHIFSAHGLSPAEYKVRWNLPSDYPMVAPSYSSTRSELAKSLGLGRKAAKRKPRHK